MTYCLQLLLVLVLYPVPESEGGVPPKNNFRHFLGKLHRPQDFQFLVDGMTRVLNQPVSDGEVFENFLDFNDKRPVTSKYVVSPRQSKGAVLGAGDDHAFLGSAAM